MNQYSKQNAIIAKIKGLVKKTGTTLFRTRKDPGISEDIAKKIQKSAYDLCHQCEKDTFTPPYKIIAEQLQVEDDQIFRAAVFSLANIAMNENKYAEDIIRILENTTEHHHRNPDQIGYVNGKINSLKNYLRNQ